MDLSDLSHSTYGPHLLLIGSVVYSAVVALVAFRLGSRRTWLVVLTVLVPLPVLFISGQHLPLVDQLSPRFYCFGDPGIIQFIAIFAPAVVPAFLSIRPSGVVDAGA